MERSELKIMLVDDEVAISKSVTDYFELEGLSAKTAQSGNQAIEFLKEEAFDLLITDVRMPDGDGIDILKYLKSTGGSNTVVVLISGQIDKKGEYTEDALFELGANKFIPKPFDVSKIVEYIVQKFDLKD